MDKKFLKFIPKFLLFSLPFSLLILSYFVLDPFRVLRKHEHYGSNFLKFSNRNVVSTSTYLYYNKDYHFKSFIFGSSRSSGFLTSDWKKHINDPNPFHFDAFNENISGIHSKMDFIKAQGGHLENVLIVLDIDSFSERFEEMGSLPHLRDPRWEGGPMLTNRNWWEFQLKFFKAYFKDYFLIKFLDARIFHTYRPWFEGAFSKHEGYYFDSPNNDFTFPMHVVEIKKDSLSYYHDPKQFKSVKKVKPHDMLIKKHHLPHLHHGRQKVRQPRLHPHADVATSSTFACRRTSRKRSHTFCRTRGTASSATSTTPSRTPRHRCCWATCSTHGATRRTSG